jgi:hypothetical protein
MFSKDFWDKMEIESKGRMLEVFTEKDIGDYVLTRGN